MARYHNPSDAPLYTKIQNSIAATKIQDGSSNPDANVELAVDFVECCISNITRSVKEKMGFSASSYAPTQTAAKQDQKQFLHGTDCKGSNGKAMREVTLRVTGIRTSPPGFTAPLILDFEKQFDKESLPLNKTNIRALGALCEEEFGSDDLEKLIGNSVVFQIVDETNPNTNKKVPALRAASGGLIRNSGNKRK